MRCGNTGGSSSSETTSLTAKEILTTEATTGYVRLTPEPRTWPLTSFLLEPTGNPCTCALDISVQSRGEPLAGWLPHRPQTPTCEVLKALTAVAALSTPAPTIGTAWAGVAEVNLGLTVVAGEARWAAAAQASDGMDGPEEHCGRADEGR